jgi:hypothetical protein
MSHFKNPFQTGMRDVLHIFTFIENQKTFPSWLAKYENVKNVP